MINVSSFLSQDTALHASVGRVHADDADEGRNGQIYYSLMRRKETVE